MYRRCAARHRHILTVITVISLDAVITMRYRYLIADTTRSVQPDRPSAWSIPVPNELSFVPEICNINNIYRVPKKSDPFVFLVVTVPNTDGF